MFSRLPPGRKAIDAAESKRPELPASPPRQAGLWNFLTWSFFLSQALAAEMFLGGAAQAAADDAGRGSTHAPGASAANLPAQVLAGVNTAQGEDVSTAVHGAAGPGAASLDPLQKGLAQGERGHVAEAAAGIEGGAGGSYDIASSAVVGRSSPAGDSDPVQAAVGELPEGPISPLLPDLPETVLDPVVATVTDTLGSVLGIVTSVVGSVGDIVGHVLAPVVEPLDALLDNSLAPVAGVVEQIAAPVAGAVNLAEAGLPEVADVVAPFANVADLLGIVASPGSIVLPEVALPGAAQADDLFADGSHTPYNLALNAAQAIPAAVPLLVAPIADKIFGGSDGSEPAHDDQQGALPQDGILHHVLDELNLRGLNDGLGL
jgi:hypothetical protein